MEQKPCFQNNTFQDNFFNSARSSYESVLERSQQLKDMIEDVILDYKFNKDAVRTSKLSQELDIQVEKFFDSLSHHKFNNAELNTITEICRKINEDPIITEIRDKGNDKRQQSEAITKKTSITPSAKPKPNLSLKNEKVLCSPSQIRYYTNDASTEEEEKGLRDIVSSVEEVSPKKEDNKPKKSALAGEKRDVIVESEEYELESKKVQEENHKAAHVEVQSKKENKEEKTQNIKKEFQELLQNMIENFEEHRVEDAYGYRQKMLEFVNKNNNDSELQGYFNGELEKHNRVITEVETWNKEIHNVLRELDDNDNFIEDKGKKNYRLHYKLSPEGKAVLKMEGTLDTPLFNVLSLMYEADGFNHWVPFCSDAKLIKPLHRAAHVYWLKYGLPFPLTARACHCFGFGVDRLSKNGSVLLMSRTINEDKIFLDHYGIELPEKKNFVLMDIDTSVEIVPLSHSKIQIRVIAKVDPHVKNTPPAILSWISKKAAQHLFEKLMKKSKNLKGTFWEKSIQEKRELYGWLEQKVDSFLKEHNLDL